MRISNMHLSSRLSTTRHLPSWSAVPTHILPSQNISRHIYRTYSTKSSNPSQISPNQANTARSAASSRTADIPNTSHPTLPHLTPSETVHMTSISHKPETTRLATAVCRITFSNPTPYSLLTTGDGHMKKGDVLSVARIAGIMAAKKAADIIPLAHPGLGITGIDVDVGVCEPDGAGDVKSGGCPHGSVFVKSSVHCHGRTGVEMEALTSVLGAALTVYDMCKAVDKGMVVGEARVVRKRGGKSGDWEEGVHVNGDVGREK